jgi:hypothetical protein
LPRMFVNTSTENACIEPFMAGSFGMDWDMGAEF